MLALSFKQMWARRNYLGMYGMFNKSSTVLHSGINYEFARSFSTGQAVEFKPFEEKEIAEIPPKCFYPAFADKEPVAKNFVDKTKNISYSSWKLNDCAKQVRGKHIIDAIKIAEGIDAKGGPILKELLEKLRRSGENKGSNPDLFFVKEAFVGKAIKSKKIDIKARGKMGVIRRPKSSLTVVLEEKPLDSMIRDMLVGKTPPGIGEIFRKRLFKANADFDDLRSYSFMTTSAGRYYRREQFKRLVLLTKKDFQKRGIRLDTKRITKYMLEKQIQMIKSVRKTNEDKSFRMRNTQRQEHFQKNYKPK